MTDKEQIMINGVDVNRCIDFNKRDKVSCYHILYDKCNENPNCYFKQLARKTQECEKLKEELATYKKMLDNPEFKIALIDVKTGEREVWRKLGNKAQKCKQALDEIEKELKEDIYCESQECGCDDFEECLNCVKTQILDIINKAKGGV